VDRRREGAFLIVDDDVALARSVARFIRPVRSCVLAHDAATARARLAEERTWCGFLIDVLLGDDSGFDVLAEARRLHPRPPAVMMTGHDNPQIPNRAYMMGSSFLAKPIQHRMMRRFIDEALAAEAGAEEPLRDRIGRLAALHRLSRAEVEILTLAVRCEPSNAIATIRGVTRNTHKAQVRSLVKKLGVQSLREAARRVIADA
jgi:FixJ family two-component response regulator